MSDTFRAIVVEQQGEGSNAKYTSSLQTLPLSRLPEGDVTLRVLFSSVNYKDGMIVQGLFGPRAGPYPLVPGIDLVGEVVESASSRCRPGDQVIVTGWGIGERHWGGYAQIARVKSEWITPLPNALNPIRAMAIGTAGLAAMMGIMLLERNGLKPENGDVLVTGAAGGVGSLAIAVLANLGYKVVASTGRREEEDYLKSLGAASVIDRNELAVTHDRFLLPERWAGAIDNVGGTTLATILMSLKSRGSVASVGLAGGRELHTTVMPFLFRGISLLGVDTPLATPAERSEAWGRLARELPLDKLDAMTDMAPLSVVPQLAKDIVAGRVRGRMVVDVNA
jgi:acrylyl-CoA reductase (NADPH)